MTESSLYKTLRELKEDRAALLEALKEAEVFIYRQTGGGETDFRAKLLAAIAKAESREP